MQPDRPSSTKYHLIVPCPQLRPYVQTFWSLTQSPDDSPVTESIPVDGGADLVLCGAAAYERSHAADRSLRSSLRSNLDGPRVHPIRIHQVGLVDIFGVRFSPGGLSTFVRTPISELIGATLCVDEVFGAAARRLEERVFSLRDPVRRATVVEGFLRSRMVESDALARLRRVLDTVEAGGGRRTVGDVALAHGMSVRTIDRLCRERLGLRPKFYSRIVRLRGVISRVRPSVELAELALSAGFYDHAHFTNEFRTLTGATPSAWRAGEGTPSRSAPIVHSFQARGRGRP